jgi:exonuclease SbcD
MLSRAQSRRLGSRTNLVLTFIHAADLHLDSPLVGLRQRASEQAHRIENASREAFDALVRLCIEERAAFLLLAGDVFDGHWRDYRTGVFFAERMAKLREAGIAVFVIRGNHDAENRFMQRLSLSDNVHMFPADAPATQTLEALGVSIHGQSYGQRDVKENLALGYPEPRAGHFNIGLLHTACTGRAGHEAYAPCSVEELTRRGYDYWALGHVHAHEVLSTAPHVVFSGNLQGRSVRETGPKGAVVVRVANGRVQSAEHRALDSVRWSELTLDMRELSHLDDVLAMLRTEAMQQVSDAAQRALAMRVVLRGPAPLHAHFVTETQHFQDDVATLFAGLSRELWLEKLSVRTEPMTRAALEDATVLGELESAVSRLVVDEEGGKLLEAVLAEIASKLPAAVSPEELLKRLRSELPQRAGELALALLGQGRG